MLWQICLFSLYFSNVIANHYETLSISRSATDYDIKKAYKKLARIWHPDKSKSPDANENFMKINEAYEVLSDPEKRREYDAFGTVSNDPRGGDGFHRAQFWSSHFGNSFFHSDEEPRENRFETVDYRNYKMNIVPDSSRKPSLLLLVTHFCMACHHAMRLWNSIADQVIDSGIRMGISDVMRDSQLREELKVHHVPSVVFVIDGQVKYMQSDINRDSIIEFLRHAFPSRLVSAIYSERDLNQFHDQWMRDSRSKMIMTKPLDRASFRYLSLAFKYRDKVTAGFVHLDTTNERIRDIVDAYGLSYDAETLLIFNDEKRSYNRVLMPKPVAQISMPRLTISDMEYTIESNHQLPLTRLLSQSVFDSACPPPSQKHRSYGFCVIAIVHSKQAQNLSEAENWQYLRSLVDSRSRGKMLYLYGDVQLNFLESLQLFEEPARTADSFINQVVLLWRQSYDSAASTFLPNPWEYPNLNWVMSNWNLLSNLDTAMPILRTSYRMQTKFADSQSLAELVDELAAPLLWRIWERILLYCYQIVMFIIEYLLDPFTVVVVLIAVVLLSYSYSTFKAVSRHISDENKYYSEAPDESSKPAGNRCDLPELSEDSYNSLLHDSRPGRLVLVMLTTDVTATESMRIMSNSVARLKCKDVRDFWALRVDQHGGWLGHVLGRIPDPDSHKRAIGLVSSLSLNRPVPEEGLVLALNITRKYLLICPINLLFGAPFPYRSAPVRSSSGNEPRSCRLRTAVAAAPSYFIESDDSDQDNIDDHAAIAQSVENSFFDWLCQLTEGTCKRFYLTQWPYRL